MLNGSEQFAFLSLYLSEFNRLTTNFDQHMDVTFLINLFHHTVLKASF